MPDYLYTRKSRAMGDADDPDLLAAHLATLQRLAAADGVTVPPENCRAEIGSGESISGRPDFAALLREWEALPPGAGGSVYVMEPSRLSRGSHQERGRIQDALIRAGLRVISPERRYDPASPSDQLLWSVVQAVDQNEVQRYKQRQAQAFADLTRRGEVTTASVPWGYRWIKSPGVQGGQVIRGHIEPDPDTFTLLQALCREVLTTSIYRLAQAYGVPHSTLQKALTSPVICGYPARRYAHHQGTRPWKETHHLLPREQWTWPEVAGNYPPACARGEWEHIQTVLAERCKLRFKLGPVVENGWCRAVVTFTGAPGPVKLGSVALHQGTAPTYTRPREGKPLLYVARQPVHDTAVLALRALCDQPLPLMQAVLALEAKREQATRARASGDLDQVRRLLARERDRYATLKGQAADPDLDDEGQLAVHAAEQDCRRRLVQLKRDLEVLGRPEAPLPDLTGLLPAFTDLGEDFTGAWASMPGAEKQAITRALLAAIPVTVIEGERRVRFERYIGAPVYPEWLRPAL